MQRTWRLTDLMGAISTRPHILIARERAAKLPGAVRGATWRSVFTLLLTLAFVLATGCADQRCVNCPDGPGKDGPVIDSVYVDGLPINPFKSEGDLWMSTWSADGNLYTGWGDGKGVDIDAHPYRTDCGIACLKGALPNIIPEERCFQAPTYDPAVNDKPSSLISIGGRLYGHFHSPLGDAWIGYLAYSDDYGVTWTRVGFYEEGTAPPAGASPWTRDRNSRFRCMFFINMGQDYELNLDGYVYGLGIGTEWNWLGGVYLARVPVSQILEYDAYEYVSYVDGAGAHWSRSESDAIALPNIWTRDQGSAIYHPGIGRYLFLTASSLFEAPNPWGPWSFAGNWIEGTADEWRGGYQPGIISKDTEPDAFWFTIAGQAAHPQINYNLHLGRMVMRLKPTGK